MAVTPVTIRVVDNSSPTGVPLEDVVIRFYDEAGVTFVTEGTTDENGELVILLEDLTTYWIRLFKIEYAFDNRLRIEVDSGAVSNTFRVVGRDLVDLPPSAVPELCRASGYVVNVAGEPHEGAIIAFNATKLPRLVGGRGIVMSKIIVVSQDDGYVEVELVRSGAYDATVQASENEVIRIKVPDAEAININDLIWPYVAQVLWDPEGPIALPVDASISVSPTVVLSTGVQTPFEYDERDRKTFGCYVDLAMSVDGIVELSYNEQTDTLLITGKSPGSVTLSATLKDGVEAVRLPEPTRDFQELTIVVT